MKTKLFSVKIECFANTVSKTIDIQIVAVDASNKTAFTNTSIPMVLLEQAKSPLELLSACLDKAKYDLLNGISKDFKCNLQ